MKRTAFLSAASLLVSGLAWAGLSVSRETQVDLVARKASGSLHATRVSADSVQYITCIVSVTPGSTGSVRCDARDAEAERLQCVSADAAVVRAALGISESSFVSFSCDESLNLSSLVVNNGSMWLP